MPHAIFELDKYKDLPLWAQVLLAARMAHRAALGLPAGVPQKQRDALVAGCEAIARRAQAGEWLKAERNTMRLAVDVQPVVDAHGATVALQQAADATHAAHDSLDFGAADAACTGSVGRALQAAAGSKGMNPVQASILMAGDLDLLRFACKEAGVGTYDGLGTAVMGRLTPVHPPGG